MTIDRRVVAAGVGLALVLAACGGSAPAGSGAAATEAAPASAPAASGEPATEAPAATTPEATESPTDDGGSGGGDGPMTDLAGMLPERVGGTTFQRTGFDGDQLGIYGAMAGLSGEQLDPILREHGKTLADVNFAIAAPADGNQAAGLVYAMQIEGVPAEDLMDVTGVGVSDMTEMTVAGKRVWMAGAGGFGVWAYPRDDIVFVILFAGDDAAKGIIEQLP